MFGGAQGRMNNGPQVQWNCQCGRYVKRHHWNCLCGQHYNNRVRDNSRPRQNRKPEQRQPSQPRRDVQRDVKREEQEIKQFIGRVIPMTRADAYWYMQSLGYEVAPNDTQAIKQYKQATKKRLFDIARLVTVARKAGKDDSNLLREVACLKYMMGTTVRLSDHLAELKAKRDVCMGRIKTMADKIADISEHKAQAECDLALWKKAIEELEELEDYQVGENGMDGDTRCYAAGAHPSEAAQPPPFPPPPPGGPLGAPSP